MIRKETVLMHIRCATPSVSTLESLMSEEREPSITLTDVGTPSDLILRAARLLCQLLQKQQTRVGIILKQHNQPILNEPRDANSVQTNTQIRIRIICGGRAITQTLE